MKRTVYNNVLAVQTLPPAAQTIATTNGATVDRIVTGTEGNIVYRSAAVLVETGVVNDGTHTVIVEHSDNGSSWDTVAAAELQGGALAVTATDDDTVIERGYLGSRRFLRVTWTQTGGTTGTTFRSATVLLGDPSLLPVARS